jgi:hypothetical protein
VSHRAKQTASLSSGGDDAKLGVGAIGGGGGDRPVRRRGWRGWAAGGGRGGGGRTVDESKSEIEERGHVVADDRGHARPIVT